MRALTIASDDHYSGGNEGLSCRLTCASAGFNSRLRPVLQESVCQQPESLHTIGGCFLAVDEGSVQAGSVTVNIRKEQWACSVLSIRAKTRKVRGLDRDEAWG